MPIPVPQSAILSRGTLPRYGPLLTLDPDGRHITSGSFDRTIRTWDAEAGPADGKPLEGHTHSVQSIAYSPDGRYIASGSYDNTTRVWDPFLYAPTQHSSRSPIHPEFFAKPDMGGWVRDSEGGLLYILGTPRVSFKRAFTWPYDNSPYIS